MPKSYRIYRSNDHDLRRQISDGLDDLSDRLGGPDNPVPPYLPAMRKGTPDLVWVPGTYYDGDTVTDDGWAMVANKETTDKPAPEPFGAPTWFLPTTPTWSPQQYTGAVYTGIEVLGPEGRIYSITSVRVWIPNVTSDAKYRVVAYNINEDLFEFGQQFSGDVLSTPGWLEVTVSSGFITEGDRFVVTLETYNASATTDFNYPWLYTGTSQAGDPGAGNWNRSNQHTIVRIDYLDADAVDRSADLATVIPGTIIRFEEEADPLSYWEYRVDNATDQLGYYQFDVTLVDAGQDVTVLDRCTVSFQVPVPTPADYVQIVDQYVSNPQIQGYISFDELTGGASNENAYGIDLQFQEYTASPDWDPLAYSGGGSSGADENLAGGGFVNFLNNDIKHILVWWARWLPQEEENFAKLLNRTNFMMGPVPTWDEVFTAHQLMAFLGSSEWIDLTDITVIVGVNWLESIGVLGPGRAAILLTP